MTEEPNMANESNIRHYNGETSLSHKARKRIREAKKKARPGKIHTDSWNFGDYLFGILICNGFRIWISIIVFIELSTRELWVERRHAENFDLTWEKVNDQLERIHTSQVSN